MYFNNIFKPGALNISAFQLIHLLVGPGLRHYVLPKKSKVLATDTSIFWWDIAMVSIAQSIVNTGVSIYLLWHSEFREGLTPQERILGYHEQTAAALAVTVGYFVFHLAQVWQNVAIEGKYMLAHSFAALYATSLAFRPLSMHYHGALAAWELPNIFLNVQRQLDKLGYRKSRARQINRAILLSSYAIVRLGFGTIVLINLILDMCVTFKDPNQVRKEHLLPGVGELGRDRLELPLLLAVLQAGSVAFLHYQGFTWFSKILKKDDFRDKLS